MNDGINVPMKEMAFAAKVEVEPPQPPLRSALTFVNEGVSQLHALLSKLEERLDQVLSPEPSVPENEVQVGQADPYRLGEQVDQTGHRVQSANSRVRSILDRLEV